MIATFTITQEDYINAARLFNRFTTKRAVIYLIVILLTGIIWQLTDWMFAKAVVTGMLIGVALVEVLARSFVNSMLLKKLYREYAAIKSIQSVELTDDGVRFSHPDSNMLLRWKYILKWRQNANYILICQNRRLYHIVPKMISEQGFPVSSLIAKLSENVGDEF